MFTFVKRIETKKDSIFYSFINYKNEILGFGRKHYRYENKIKLIKVDESFNIIEDNNQLIDGEDPRCIIHKEKLYVTDNYANKQKIYDYENNKYIKINIQGKNLSLISHKDELYFIHSTKPFVIYKLDINNENIENIVTKQTTYDVNSEYRGGTSGYRLKKNPNMYYGFGHRTYYKNNILLHDIFLWIVDFTNEHPSINVIDVEKPKNAKNICDPTCVIEINNKLYLITAESDYSWFCQQDYITNVYEITDNNFLQMVM